MSILDLPSSDLYHKNPLFNAIPFPLGHIQVFSIPDIYLPYNPKMVITTENEDILNVICEQIVFDNDLLNGLNIPEVKYDQISLIDNSFF